MTLSFRQWLEDTGPVTGPNANTNYRGFDRIESKYMSGRKKVSNLPGPKQLGDPVDPDDNAVKPEKVFGKMKKKMKKDSK